MNLPPEKCYIIAEAGVNHNGSLDLALSLVDAASEAGADAVKFQTFKADELASESAPKATYQQKNTGNGGSQLEMLKKLELGRKEHEAIIEHCHKNNIEFLSTPFDFPSLSMLLELGIETIKVSSGEITNGPLLLKIAHANLPVILSTGMSTLEEIKEALGVLAFGFMNPEITPLRKKLPDYYHSGKEILQEKVAVLHCTTQYPTPFEGVNLNAMATISSEFGLCTGFSDHTSGIEIPLAAAAKGASIIEKHLTLDKNLPGPDHQASLEPKEFAAMVKGIRNIESAMGNGIKKPADCEMANINIARKSLVISGSGKITPDKISIKRPGGGRSPMDYWDILQDCGKDN